MISKLAGMLMLNSFFRVGGMKVISMAIRETVWTRIRFDVRA